MVALPAIVIGDCVEGATDLSILVGGTDRSLLVGATDNSILVALIKSSAIIEWETVGVICIGGEVVRPNDKHLGTCL